MEKGRETNCDELEVAWREKRARSESPDQRTPCCQTTAAKGPSMTATNHSHAAQLFAVLTALGIAVLSGCLSEWAECQKRQKQAIQQRACQQNHPISRPIPFRWVRDCTGAINLNGKLITKNNN